MFDGIFFYLSLVPLERETSECFKILVIFVLAYTVEKRTQGLHEKP